MICSEKERESCNVEKLGCNGCYYNKPSKEEIGEYKETLKDLIDDEDVYSSIKQAVNGVIKYIDYLEQENAELKTQTKTEKIILGALRENRCTYEEMGKYFTKRTLSVNIHRLRKKRI